MTRHERRVFLSFNAALLVEENEGGILKSPGRRLHPLPWVLLPGWTAADYSHGAPASLGVWLFFVCFVCFVVDNLLGLND